MVENNGTNASASNNTIDILGRSNNRIDILGRSNNRIDILGRSNNRIDILTYLRLGSVIAN